MPISLEQLWNLSTESRLLSSEEVAALGGEFSQAWGADAPAETAARWLIENRKISAYQAKVLLAGRAGPFVYGDYRIHDRIESGRLAGIFRAVHIATKHPVCLYFLTGDAATDPEVIERLTQQAAAANRASVGHPHLLRCYHLADEKTFKFIVLQDLQGKRLERQLATDGALAPHDACNIARQAALGLGRVHAMGLVHGDIRPANVWIETDGAVKLLLFPLARDPLATEPLGQLVREKKSRRPPSGADYLAPELIDGKQPADVRSDIYSLGCTLYHALANQPPFAGGDLQQKLDRHRNELPVPLDQVNPKVPAALAKLVNYMLAKDPELRYQQANSVVEALLPHLTAGEGETKPRAPSKRSRAYEAWLLTHLAKTQPAAAKTPAADHISPAAPAHSTPSPVAAATIEIPADTPAGIPAAAVVASAVPVSAIPVGNAVPFGSAVPVGSAMPAAVAMPVAPFGAPPAGVVPAALAVPVGAPMAATAMPVAPFGYQQPMPDLFAQPAMAHGGASALDGVTVASGDESAGIRSRRAQQRGRRMSTIGGLVVLLLVAGGGAAFYFLGGQKLLEPSVVESSNKPEEPPPAATEGPDVKPDDSVAVTEPEPTEPIWSDDGVWSSPTHGKPLDVAWLAPGPEAVVGLRVGQLLAHPEGAKLLDSRVLGPLGDWVRTQLPAMVGTELANIDQVVVGLLDVTGEPRLAIVAHLNQPVPEDKLVAAWGSPGAEQAGEKGDKKYFVQKNQAWYVPASQQGKVVVIAPPTEMKDIIAGDGQATLLPLNIERLLKDSDGQRIFTFVAGPSLMMTAGKGLYSGAAARLKDGVDWFLTGFDSADPTTAAGTMLEPPKGVLVSAHLTDDLFVEVRVANDEAGPEAPAPAAGMRKRVGQLADKVTDAVAGLDLTPYSQKVLFRFPNMIKALQQFTRVGTGDKEIISRTYLPAAAAHNLVLGTYLSLLENPRGSAGPVAMASGSGAPAASGPLTAAKALDKKITISFPRNTLEVTMQLMADEIGIPITIIGTDLQLDGITKNQSFGLDERDKPARETFLKVLKQANPDGKLVYIFKPKEGGGEEILVTTRAAVAKRGDKLPPELEKAPADPKKKK